MEIHTGMTQKNREIVGIGLAKLLADTYATYLKTQNFHWNLTGPEFYALHILFEKQYEELAEANDEIAERIRALGFYVDATFQGFSEQTKIPEDDKVLSQKDMIQKLIEAHEILMRHARQLAQVAEKENDPATVDLLSRRLGAHEKMTWMLRSQL